MAIVIVDDTVFSLEVIKAFLLKEGYLDVITVKSARELYECRILISEIKHHFL